MCGIGGFRRFGDAPPITREQIDLMLIGLQNRGIDATGVAMLNVSPEGAATVDVYKDDKPAWQFVNDKGYLDFMEAHLGEATKTILLHTRAATIGSPIKMCNNHPMYHNRIAVVHNGGISNHDTLFKDMNLDRHAETDSDILRAILDDKGFTKKAIRDIARCTGSIAAAAIDPEDPTRTFFVRSGSPLVMARCGGNTLVWASERHHVYKAMRGWEDWLGLEWQKARTDISFLQMRDNTAWILGEDGVEWHDACQTVYSNWTEPRRHIWENYVARKTKFAAEGGKEVSKVVVSPKDVGFSTVKKPIRIPCQNKSCMKLNKLDRDSYNGINLATLKCGSCQSFLLTRTN